MKKVKSWFKRWFGKIEPESQTPAATASVKDAPMSYKSDVVYPLPERLRSH